MHRAPCHRTARAGHGRHIPRRGARRLAERLPEQTATAALARQGRRQNVVAPSLACFLHCLRLQPGFERNSLERRAREVARQQLAKRATHIARAAIDALHAGQNDRDTGWCSQRRHAGRRGNLPRRYRRPDDNECRHGQDGPLRADDRPSLGFDWHGSLHWGGDARERCKNSTCTGARAADATPGCLGTVPRLPGCGASLGKAIDSRPAALEGIVEALPRVFLNALAPHVRTRFFMSPPTQHHLRDDRRYRHGREGGEKIQRVEGVPHSMQDARARKEFSQFQPHGNDTSQYGRLGNRQPRQLARAGEQKEEQAGRTQQAWSYSNRHAPGRRRESKELHRNDEQKQHRSNVAESVPLSTDMRRVDVHVVTPLHALPSLASWWSRASENRTNGEWWAGPDDTRGTGLSPAPRSVVPAQYDCIAPRYGSTFSGITFASHTTGS